MVGATPCAPPPFVGAIAKLWLRSKPAILRGVSSSTSAWPPRATTATRGTSRRRTPPPASKRCTRTKWAASASGKDPKIPFLRSKKRSTKWRPISHDFGRGRSEAFRSVDPGFCFVASLLPAYLAFQFVLPFQPCNHVTNVSFSRGTGNGDSPGAHFRLSLFWRPVRHPHSRTPLVHR